MRVIALIPARAGSQRLPGKNMRLLGGRPLIQWTIDAAKDSGVFDTIVVCSDDATVLALASLVSVEGLWRESVPDDQPDIVWVRQALAAYPCEGFSILRPTSPFRSGDSIRCAWERLRTTPKADSLRAMRPVTEHPGKMWWPVQRDRASPVLPRIREGVPWHSSPTQVLPPIYIQTAGLECCWTRTVTQFQSISGHDVIPFLLTGAEALDINTADDWTRAEAHLAQIDALARVSTVAP